VCELVLNIELLAFSHSEPICTVLKSAVPNLLLISLLNTLYSLVPALAVGFDDLRQRVEAQSQQAATHEEKLKV